MPLPFIAWLFIGVVAVIAGYAIMAALMPKPDGPNYKDFEIPTADPNRPIPWMAGTVEISGLSVLWSGDKSIKKKKATRKRGPQTHFHAGVLYGICHGKVDAILGMKLKDKIIFPPSQVVANGNENEEDARSEGFGSIYSDIVRGRLANGGTSAIVDGIDMRERMPAIPELSEKLNSGSYFGDLYGSTSEIKTGASRVELYYPNIFGGKDGNGGIRGYVAFSNGSWNQVLDSAAKGRIRAESFPDSYLDRGIPAPNFRGIATAYMGGGPGFGFGFNDPTMPAAKVRVMRVPRVPLAMPAGDTWSLDERETLMVTPRSGNKLWRFPQANPAAAMYELLTDRDVGGAYSHSEMDITSFVHCARILSREKMGLGILWTRSGKIEDILKTIGEICSGVVFADPETGQMTMRLLRSDEELEVFFGNRGKYPEGSEWHKSNFLPLREDLVFHDGNARVAESTATTYATSTTHISVKFKNDVTEEDTAITEVNDGALVRSDGLSNEDERDYPFIRDPDTARLIAQRELRNSSKPTIQVKLEIGPIARTIRPYDVVTLKMSDPSVPAGRYRVTKVPYGGTEEQDFTLELVDDIFSQIGVISPRKAPVEWASRSTELVSSVNRPYTTFANARDLIEFGYSVPEVNGFEGGFARHLLSSPQRVSYWQAVESSGAETEQADVPPVSAAITKVAFDAEKTVFTRADLPFDVNANDDIQAGAEILFVRPTTRTDDLMTFVKPSGSGAVPSGYVLSSEFAPQDAVGAAAMALDDTALDPGNLGVQYREEIVRVTAIDNEGTITVSRGRNGTTPAPIMAGSWAFLLPEADELHNVTEFTEAGDQVSGKYVPFNGAGNGIVMVEGGQIESFGRHLLPERPGRASLTAGGETATIGGLIALEDPADVTVNWARRNRIRDVPYASTTDIPEAGVSTFVRLWRRVTVEKVGRGNRMKAVCLHEERGISGTSHVIPASVIEAAATAESWNTGTIDSDVPDFLGASMVVEVGSHRGDDNSLFNPLIRLDVGREYPGYGDAYGYSYGGPDRGGL